MDVSEAKRLRELEDENRKLKELVAEQSLDSRLEGRGLIKMVTPAARRAAVRHVEQAHGLSERRASRLVGIGRSSLRYRPGEGDEVSLRERLRELAAKWRRFGYRQRSWGDWRVWLDPLPGTSTLGRSGFSIHGGSYPGSQGCIDLCDRMPSFVESFRQQGRDMLLRAEYPR